MWLALSNMLRPFLAVLCTGLAVKLMDDAIDDEKSALFGLPQRALVPYAAALMTVGAALSAAVALPLFAAAYAIGMLTDPGQRLPTGIPAWLESVAALAVSLAIVGPFRTAHGFLIIAGLQLFDDILDYRKDRAIPGRNWAWRIGRVEAALLALICLILSTLFGPSLAAWVFAVYCLVLFAENFAREDDDRCFNS